MRVGPKHMAAFFRGPVPQQLQQPFRVDGVAPNAILLLKIVRGELHDQHLGPGVLLEVAVEGQVARHGEHGVGDSDVAGVQAGVAVQQRGIDAGHGGRIAKDQNVATPMMHAEDRIVGLHPDTGAVVQEKVGTAQHNAQRHRKQRRKDDHQAVQNGRTEVPALSLAGGTAPGVQYALLQL